MVGSAWMPWLRPTVGVTLCSRRALLQRGQHQVDVLQQEVGGAGELHGERGVEHVGRGHALVQEARLRADDLGDVGQEGDDVVLRYPLDLVDLLDMPGGSALSAAIAFLPPAQIAWAASLGMIPSSAMASAAWASISNQMRKRFSGVQMAAICGRE